MTTGWRAMAEADLPRVLAVADRVHVDYPERPEIFAERLRLFPAGARIALIDGEVVGYGIIHPARSGRPPALDSLLGALAADADVLYLHDIALLPEARGHGLGEAVVTYADDVAIERGLARLALTSTPGARTYWLSRGFVPEAGDAALRAKLASYGEGMVYMERPAGAGLVAERGLPAGVTSGR